MKRKCRINRNYKPIEEIRDNKVELNLRVERDYKLLKQRHRENERVAQYRHRKKINYRAHSKLNREHNT